MANLDGTDDVFDSRDVVERIAEIEAEEADLDIDNDYDEILELRDELSALTALRDEFNGTEFEDGITLISDDYKAAYFEEYVEELGYSIPSFVTVDWDETADTLLQDYTPVEFHGVTYWGRA